MIDKVNLAQQFGKLSDPWQPRVVRELNDQYVKVVRFAGEYLWHSHQHEDEMFLVVRGHIRICLRDGELALGPGEFAVIPRGVEHKPVADGAADVVLFEPATTRTTGDVDDARTIEPEDLARL